MPRLSSQPLPNGGGGNGNAASLALHSEMRGSNISAEFPPPLKRRAVGGSGRETVLVPRDQPGAAATMAATNHGANQGEGQ